MQAVFEFDWVDFFKRLYKKSDDSDLFNRAAQAAFYFSFALFPFVFFLVSLFGLVLETTDALKSELYNYLRQIMPASVFVLVRNTVDEIAANSSGSKLTLGLIVALWSASAGVDAVRGALNSVYELRERRSWFWTKFQSLILTLVVTVLAALGLSIMFYGWQLVQAGTNWIGMPITSPLVLVGIQWISILFVMLLACEVIYNFLPDFRKFKWIWITAGSLVAIVLWLLLTGSFRLYLNYFNNYDKTYGSLGAVIILLLWLYLTAMVLMVGGAINAVLHDLRNEEEDTSEVIAE
ncbi:MAG: YihY/virulence factor BrkB family protein [Pyrinomonadaceae bacterium]|nr:YihY/virulence factor BrkB family protein [Acidobacteriota bacterium]MBK7934353.1 YihY/virulence factor BrkB family protein [Acidobacteriota bacterium]MBP7376025.1 YihY/virulence factor BrkB family protein [Pyrinomonadaceae bacterium]